MPKQGTGFNGPFRITAAADTVTAAGASVSAATSLASDTPYIIIGTVASAGSSGVKLADEDGLHQYILNATATAAVVYPPTGKRINNLTVSVSGYTIGAGTSVFVAQNGTRIFVG